MNINLFAFNLATSITNTAHSAKRTVEGLVPSVTSYAVRSVDAVSDVATSFAAGVRYANIVNKQTGQSAALLTGADGENLQKLADAVRS